MFPKTVLSLLIIFFGLFGQTTSILMATNEEFLEPLNYQETIVIPPNHTFFTAQCEINAEAILLAPGASIEVVEGTIIPTSFVNERVAVSIAPHTQLRITGNEVIIVNAFICPKLQPAQA